VIYFTTELKEVKRSDTALKNNALKTPSNAADEKMAIKLHSIFRLIADKYVNLYLLSAYSKKQSKTI
jgi:hypothetical protein